MPGPIPKPDAQLQRPRTRKGKEIVPTTVGERKPVLDKPEPDPSWHPLAIGLYGSVENSGQSEFYQESDWWVLFFVCESISHYLKPTVWVDDSGVERTSTKRNGQILSAINSAMTSLLLTEGDRRRVRMELQAPPEVQPDLTVVAMDKYRGVAE